MQNVKIGAKELQERNNSTKVKTAGTESDAAKEPKSEEIETTTNGNTLINRDNVLLPTVNENNVKKEKSAETKEDVSKKNIFIDIVF